MDCKLAYMAAALALITPFIPTSLTGVDGWQRVGISAAATLLYVAAKHFELKQPAGNAQLEQIEQELTHMRERLSIHSIKLGMGKYERKN